LLRLFNNFTAYWLTVYLTDVTCISDSLSLLTKKPQNALVVGDQNAQLNCSTDGVRGNLIEWTYDHDHIVWPPCVSQDLNSLQANSPNPATDCNINALSSSYGGISGAYVCSDRTQKAIAMVIVLGSILLMRLIVSCITNVVLLIIDFYDYRI